MIWRSSILGDDGTDPQSASTDVDSYLKASEASNSDLSTLVSRGCPRQGECLERERTSTSPIGLRCISFLAFG